MCNKKYRLLNKYKCSNYKYIIKLNQNYIIKFRLYFVVNKHNLYLKILQINIKITYNNIK